MILSAREFARRVVFRNEPSHSLLVRKNRAFTLIELMTVMAISAVLMGLIVVPLVQSFNMTRTAQAFADAQDRARVITERIAFEVGNAVSVRSGNGLVAVPYNGSTDKLPAHSLIAQLPNDTGRIVDVVLPYAKIDIVNPAEGDPGNVRTDAGGTAYVDPTTGIADPTLEGPKGQVNTPVRPGLMMTRYFIGLKNPLKEYNNPYDGIVMARNANPDNLYVLYKAQFQPVLPGGAKNTALFEVDANGNLLMDDPKFFVPNRDNNGQIITTDAKADRIRAWLSTGRGSGHAILQTELSRYDMVQVAYSTANRRPIYDSWNDPVSGGTILIPRVVPLIQFAPGHVSNEPAEGRVATRPGEETDNSAAIAPDVYVTRYGLWDRALIRNWPKFWNPNDSNANEYSVLRGDITSGDGPGFPTGVSIYAYDPDVSPFDFDSGTEVFDVSLYELAAANSQRYPFSQAANAADSRSGWFSSPRARAVFVPFTYQPGSGKVRTSFLISEVGDPAVNPPATNPQNLPSKVTCGPDGPTTPLTDTDTSGLFWDPRHDPINEKFNKVWVDHPNLQPDVHRFIDLRVALNADGSISPMHPTLGFARASMVPGSEEVYGPDQLPGPNYGTTIRYTRITGRNPGPNQYRINYVDQPQPTNDTGAVDYTVIGLSASELAGFNPNVYNDKNFASAVIQPRYKKGYLQLNSDPNVPLPNGEIMVSYRFQFNSAGGGGTGSREDVFAVDYDTRQLMNVLVTIRNYPQSSMPNPQGITLKSTAAVRNYIR
jgi:prepilin-type N-terminal cleavage/methylation domain-containing protein